MLKMLCAKITISFPLHQKVLMIVPRWWQMILKLQTPNARVAKDILLGVKKVETRKYVRVVPPNVPPQTSYTLHPIMSTTLMKSQDNGQSMISIMKSTDVAKNVRQQPTQQIIGLMKSFVVAKHKEFLIVRA